MWPLKSIEHVVLVHKTNRDPEIHPGESLEPADYKKGDVQLVGWLSMEVPSREVLDLPQAGQTISDLLCVSQFQGNPFQVSLEEDCHSCKLAILMHKTPYDIKYPQCTVGQELQ